MTAYTGTFDKSVPGLRFIDRSGEGFLDVVYDLGLDGATEKLYDCGPYVLTVLKDGQPFGQPILRPNHFYGSSWWIDLVPVTNIIRDPKTLIDDKLVPPFGDTGIPVRLPVPGSVTFPGPMEISSGVTGREGTTGGRPDIGILSAWGAEFMLTGDSRNMLQIAKMVATEPVWHYDAGRLLNLIANPKITAYPGPQQGGAPNWLGPFPPEPVQPVDMEPRVILGETVLVNVAPQIPLQQSFPDTGHMLDVCGLAALATGAPRYVRGVQACVIHAFASDNYFAGSMGGVTVLYRQMRGTAWLLRQLFSAYWATLLAEQAGNLPSDCLPSSHFKQIIDNQADQFHKFIEPTPAFQSFGVWYLQDAQIGWWQCDMLNQVLGRYAAKWPAVWGPIYIKTLRNLMARVNGDGLGQWPPAMPTWYWANVCSDTTGRADQGTFRPGVIPYAGFPTLWTEYTKVQLAGIEPSGNNSQITAAQVAALAADPLNGGKFLNGMDGEYLCWMIGALADVVYNDRGVLAGAISAAYPNLEQAYAQQMVMMGKWGSLTPQCSIAVDSKPVTLPPPGLPITVHGLLLRAQNILALAHR